MVVGYLVFLHSFLTIYRTICSKRFFNKYVLDDLASVVTNRYIYILLDVVKS